MTEPKSRDLNDLAVAGELPDDLKSICKRVQVRPSKAPVEITDRPIVHVTTELSKNVNEAEAVLGQDPTIFQRDGQLVRVVRVARSEASATLHEGTPTIRVLAASTCREILAERASFLRYDARADDYLPCLPTRDIVDALISRGEYPHVRPITGIVESPMWLGDNQIMQEPGYDSSTGFLYAPNIEFPPVPDNPTKQEVADAIALVREVWCDFPWRSDNDFAVVVSLVLSMICRPSIGDVPGHCFDANIKGSGKGRVVDVASLIVTGRISNKQSWPGDPAEQDKVLGAVAMQGVAHLPFDDLKTAFGGNAVCKVLTCNGGNAFRILGKTQLAELPWRTIITATANNIGLEGDVTRRVIVARLETTLERPELRKREEFRHPDLFDWALANRARITVAFLTIVRAWWLAGKPSMGLGTLGSFEQWAALAPAVSVWAGLGNPLECCPSNQSEDDPILGALRCVIESWPVIAPRGETLRAVIERLYPDSKPPKLPDAQSDLRNALETLAPPKHDGYAPDSRKLGNAFSALRGRVVAGAKLDCTNGHGGWKIWSIKSSSRTPKTTDTLQKKQQGFNFGESGESGETNPTIPCLTVKKNNVEMTDRLTTAENVSPASPVSPAQELHGVNAEYASKERLLDGLVGFEPCDVCGCHPCQCEVLGL